MADKLKNINNLLDAERENLNSLELDHHLMKENQQQFADYVISYRKSQ